MSHCVLPVPGGGVLGLRGVDPGGLGAWPWLVLRLLLFLKLKL